MKIIFALICVAVIGYVLYNRKMKVIQESGLTGRILYRTFSISLKYPFDENHTIELISINEDKSATIRTLLSDETLTAKPSEYFIGEDYGTFGLQLISVSKEKCKILLKQRAPENIG
jgi:hypothetical protein